MSSVHLRPLRPDDAELLFTGLTNPELYTYLEEAPPASKDWLAERFSVLAAGAPSGVGETWLNWVIEDSTSRLALGTAQATIYEDGAPTSIAYLLFRQSWGQGFASAAVKHVLHQLATNFGVTEVQAEIHEQNERSWRLVERLGFQHVDTVPEDGYHDLIYRRRTSALE